MYVKTLHGLSLNGAWQMQLRLYFAWIACAALAFLFTRQNLLQYPATLLTVHLVSGTAVILYALIRKKENFRFVPQVHITAQTMLLALVMGLSLVVLNDAASQWLPLPYWPEVSFTRVNTASLYTITGSVMIAAFMEEILFRGIIMEALLKRYSGRIALLQSSLLFMLAHPDPSQMPGAFLLGLLTGYFYLRQRDLCMCFFIHLTNNVVTAILMLNSSLFFSTMEPGFYYGLLLTGVLVLWGGYFLLKRLTVGAVKPSPALLSE
ncbi:CPBP family intramembrane glutamic endopeptidase [Chitinophaga sp. XS-30]|uniref:CPBP family intramembrane glutamic endopeptidase n=1 Tax=Chitinophaga sp. XS-30 TaxID=2604421 RepID=UPI0011DE1498|nr:type II CAAX endopeptidase family protein [Chitinophaga sp. XS-30]QEH40294.1 CPBP family intramembrane metalloprotease [Chitinophaga sp. XS-30]